MPARIEAYCGPDLPRRPQLYALFGKRIVTQQTREAMKQLLAGIRDGSFAKEWIAENEKGCPNFLARRKAEQQHPIEQIGLKLRAMMPFLNPVVAPGLNESAATAKK